MGKRSRRRQREGTYYQHLGGPTLTMLVMAGGGAAGQGDPVAFEDASLALLERADALGQEAVNTVIGVVVSTVLASLWEHGWQPTELARASRRRRSSRHTDLLITAMGADGGWVEAKGATPPKVWTTQLDDLGVVGWWGAGPDWLGPWVARSKMGWPESLMLALEMLGVIMALPALEALLPPPSQWAGWRPTENNTDADDPVLAKVRALLAKAESTSFEAEAEALTAKAQQLMARHAIDEAIARSTSGGSRRDQPIARRFAIDDPYASAKSLLLSGVASTNGGRSIWYEEFALMTVVAFEADLDAIDTLFTSLLIQGTRAMLGKGKVVDQRGRSRTRSYRQSFLVAFADRIHQRLEEAANAAVHQAEEELTRSVLPVLAGRDEEVDDAVAAMFPKLGRRRGPRITNREGWIAGRTAAELASLGPEGVITESAS